MVGEGGGIYLLLRLDGFLSRAVGVELPEVLREGEGRCWTPKTTRTALKSKDGRRRKPKMKKANDDEGQSRRKPEMTKAGGDESQGRREPENKKAKDDKKGKDRAQRW